MRDSAFANGARRHVFEKSTDSSNGQALRNSTVAAPSHSPMQRANDTCVRPHDCELVSTSRSG